MPNSVNVLFKKGLLTELFDANGSLKSGIIFLFYVAGVFDTMRC